MGQPKNQPPQESTPVGKTVFYSEGGTAALLVIRVGNHFRNRQLAVNSAQGALDWCLANGAGLVFYRFAQDPARN